jgi:hypothetical protein
MPWSPERENAPLSLDWYLGLFLTPSETALIKRRRDWGRIQGALVTGLRELDPATARALSRKNGLAPALSDREHKAVVRYTAYKPGTGRRTNRRRRNTGEGMERLQGQLQALLTRSRRRNPAKGGRVLGKTRYGVNIAAQWRQALSSIYKSDDHIVIATREAVQNGVDAIRKRWGKRAGGEFRVNWKQESDGTLTISWQDNGTGMAYPILVRFTDLADSPKRDEASDTKATIQLGDEKGTSIVKSYRRQDANGSYWIRLNGLYQFRKGPQEGETLKRDYVLDYITSGPTGGFGQAKAVILGISDTFDWDITTNDLYQKGGKMDEDMDIQEALKPIKGTKITVRGIPVKNKEMKASYRDSDYLKYYDDEQDKYLTLDERLTNVLAANDLPGIKLYLNGRRIKPFFQGKRSIAINVSSFGNWGWSGVPGDAGYPLSNGRDSLKYSPSSALDAFARHLKSEQEGSSRISAQDEVYDPGTSTDSTAIRMAEELGFGLDNPEIEEMIRDASASMVSFFDEMVTKQLPGGEMISQAPVGGRVEPEKGVKRGIPDGSKLLDPKDLPPGAATIGGSGEMIIETAEDLTKLGLIDEDGNWIGDEGSGEGVVGGRGTPVQISGEAAKIIAGNLKQVLTAGDEAVEDKAGSTVVLDYESERVLERIADTGQISAGDINTMGDILTKVSEQAQGSGGGGLQQVVAAQDAVKDIIKAAIPKNREAVKAKKEAKDDKRFNPFGAMAGLVISKEKFLNAKGKFDSARASRFKADFAKWLPWLMYWDGVCRLITSQSKIRAEYKPGFILNNDVLAVYYRYPSGTRTVMFNPFAMRDAAKAFKADSLAFAAYTHSLAVHEITHMLQGTQHSEKASWGAVETHGNEFAVERENLGQSTSPFLPAIAALAESYLGKERGINMKPAAYGRGKRWKKDAETCKKEAAKNLKKLKTQLATQKTKYAKQIKTLKAQSKVSCKTCYDDLLKVLDSDGRLDTLDWLNIKTGR